MHRKDVIDRYLAEGLPAKAEGRLREHLKGCPACRQYYDDQVLLHRALAGSASQPSAGEAGRMERLALSAAGLSLPGPQKASVLTSMRSALDALLWMPRRSLAVAAVAVVLLVAGAFVLGTRPVLAGRVVAVEGARVEGTGAATGMAILSGQTINVLAGGAMEIALERGGRIRLFPGVRATLSPRGEAVELERGKVWCEVERTGGVFAVRTDAAEARVLGTSFFVEKQKGVTEVRVVSGTVEVEDAGRRGTQLVKSGQKTRVARGAAPLAATRYTGEDDRLEWDRIVRGLGKALKELIGGQ